MKEKLHYILLLITVLLVASISLANIQSVNVSFILFSFKLPLILKARPFLSSQVPSRWKSPFDAQARPLQRYCKL